MDIYNLKARFDAIQPSSPSPACVEAVWRLYSETLREQVEDEDSEEFGFSAGVAEYRVGSRVVRDESLYQVYFGRLIDARKGCAWQTAEMWTYVRYPMNQVSLGVAEKLDEVCVEGALRLSDGGALIRQKLDAYMGSIAQIEDLWAAVRTQPPLLLDVQFTIQ
jgi:hypothetical protein